MTSIYSSIFIETELLTHFTVYKAIALYWNGIIHVFLKKQVLEPILYISFKVELSTNGLEGICFLILKPIYM